MINPEPVQDITLGRGKAVEAYDFLRSMTIQCWHHGIIRFLMVTMTPKLINCHLALQRCA